MNVTMRVSAALAGVILLGGCATPYRQGGRYGYHSMRWEDTLAVSFEGNEWTSSSAASDYAKLRCAELCLQNGCRFFTIREDGRDAGGIDPNGELSRQAWWRRPTWSLPTGATVCQIVVTCHKERPSGGAVDAEETGRALAGAHGLAWEAGHVLPEGQ